jgi:hypothetical protein
MTASYSNRMTGIETSTAIKAPVVATTTANITLSGEQTLDGVAVTAGDRVLVKDQTDTTENGIYDVAAAAWARAKDFDGTGDAIKGSLVFVQGGTLYANTLWSLTTANPDIGSSNLTFAQTTFAIDAGGGAFTDSIVVAGASPYVEVGDTDENGVVRFRQSGAIAWVDVDPGNVDANSSFQIWVDGVNVLTVNRFGHLRFGDGGDPSISLEIAGSDAILLPVGTDAQRPGTPVVGYLRVNSDADDLVELYADGTWQRLVFENSAQDLANKTLKGSTMVETTSANWTGAVTLGLLLALRKGLIRDITLTGRHDADGQPQ